MADRIITITRADDVKPLGEPGQRSYEFITGVVERELGAQHAALFAEPELKLDGVAWTTGVAGVIHPLDAKTEAEQANLTQSLGLLVADILAVAERYASERDPAAHALANALKNAVEVPGDDCIFAVGDQPVIVRWAHLLDVHTAPNGVLSRLVAPRAPSNKTSTEATSSTSTAASMASLDALPTDSRLIHHVYYNASGCTGWLWWLGWLVLAILIAVFLYRALPACGITTGWWLGGCAQANAAMTPNDTDLQSEIDSLERQVFQAGRQCNVQGDIPKTSVEPSIEDVLREQDTAKLKGCWNLGSDYTLYIEGDTDRPVSVTDWNVCFDGNGGGEQDVMFSDGTGCAGPVNASFDEDGRLMVLDEGNVQCRVGPRAGSQIIKRRTQCDVGAQNQAQCWSADATDSERGSEITLGRSEQ